MVLFTTLLLSSITLAKVYFKENFSKGLTDRWVVSETKSNYGAWEVGLGEFYADADRSKGLKTTQDKKFYAISAPLDEVLNMRNKTMVIQFTVKFVKHAECGGGYLKIMPPNFDPKAFDDETVYNIMFGPDLCGAEKSLHTILRYRGTNFNRREGLNPGEIAPPNADELTHLYTFVLNPDQTYAVYVDRKKQASGKIFADWDMLPEPKIKDPDAEKPDDWVDNPRMIDPDDVKPAGWDDEPKFIEDPTAVKPEDWDEVEDGPWVKPKISNPKYKGKWKPKRIPNPYYDGPWVHPMIDNPEYDKDAKLAYKNAFIGFDLWHVKAGTIFDDIIVTDSLQEANEYADKTWSHDESVERQSKEKLEEIEKERQEEIQKKRREKEKKRRKKKKKMPVYEEYDDEEDEMDDDEL